jgi:Fe-S-cluster-containing dehydrogenase component
MCASVCPSQALFFGTREEIEKLRPRSRAIQQFQFGDQTIKTKVNMMVPKESRHENLEVSAAMYESVSTESEGDDPIMVNLQPEQ